MHTATKAHVGLYGPTAARICVNVHGLYWHRRSVVCDTMSCSYLVVHAAPRAMLPLGVILMRVAFTATWDYADVHDPGCLKGLVWVCGPIAIGGHVRSLCCCQKPWGSPWCVLPLMTKSKKATFEVILMQLRKREMWKASVTMPYSYPNPTAKN